MFERDCDWGVFEDEDDDVPTYKINSVGNDNPYGYHYGIIHIHSNDGGTLANRIVDFLNEETPDECDTDESALDMTDQEKLDFLMGLLDKVNPYNSGTTEKVVDRILEII